MKSNVFKTGIKTLTMAIKHLKYLTTTKLLKNIKVAN